MKKVFLLSVILVMCSSALAQPFGLKPVKYKNLQFYSSTVGDGDLSDDMLVYVSNDEIEITTWQGDKDAEPAVVVVPVFYHQQRVDKVHVTGVVIGPGITLCYSIPIRWVGVINMDEWRYF
jgi:hypothetical protein